MLVGAALEAGPSQLANFEDLPPTPLRVDGTFKVTARPGKLPDLDWNQGEAGPPPQFSDSQIEAAARYLLGKFAVHDSTMAKSPAAHAHAITWATELLDVVRGLSLPPQEEPK